MKQYGHKMFGAGPGYFGNLAPKAPKAPTASQTWTSGILRPSEHRLGTSAIAPQQSQYKHKMFAAGPSYYGSDPTPGWSPTSQSNPAPYSLSQFGVPSVPRTSVGPFHPANTDMLRPSNRRDAGNAATYGIDPDIISSSGKSDWEMDDDTRDYLTDAFTTLNQEEAAYGSGGGSSGGGGGGGLGGQFSGGPGTQHGTTWSFGKRPAFKPQGIF